VNHISYYALQALSWLLVITGVFMLYAGVFLYENTQKRLQNRLVELWIRIDDRRLLEEGVLRNLIVETSTIVDRVFNRVFGEKVISVKAVVTSTYLALASFFLLSYIDALHEVSLAIAGLVCLAIAGLLILFNFFFLPVATVALVIIMAWLVDRSPAGGIVGLLLLPLVLDVAWLYGSRRLMRAASQGRSVWWIVAWNLTTLILFLPAPMIYGGLLDRLPAFLALALISVSYTRLFPIACALVLVLLASAALLHRYLWRFPNKVIYALQRHEVISKPKLLVRGGITLIGLGSGSLRWIEAALGKLSG
jgi:hypothetical protein